MPAIKTTPIPIFLDFLSSQSGSGLYSHPSNFMSVEFGEAFIPEEK